MRIARLRGDFSLLRQGLGVAAGFGLRSLEGFVGVAELLERSIYEPRSLVRTPEGFAFTLLNPPLRMGAFSAARLLWNGTPVPPSDARIRLGSSPEPIAFRDITPARPITVPIGERSRVSATLPGATDDVQHVRLELQSVAIPPLVWFEFTDRARAANGSA